MSDMTIMQVRMSHYLMFLTGEVMPIWPETDAVTLRGRGLPVRFGRYTDGKNEQKGDPEAGTGFSGSGRRHSGRSCRRFKWEQRYQGGFRRGGRGVDGSTPHHVVPWSDFSGGHAAVDLLDPAQAILKVLDDAFRNQEAGIDDAVVRNPVIAFQPLLSPVDDAVVVHEGEVLRNVCLACADFIDDFLYGMLTIAERSEYLQPHGFGEQLESVRNGLEHFIGHVEMPFLDVFFGNRNCFAHDKDLLILLFSPGL